MDFLVLFCNTACMPSSSRISHDHHHPSPIFFTNPDCKSANCPSQLFWQSLPMYWFFMTLLPSSLIPSLLLKVTESNYYLSTLKKVGREVSFKRNLNCTLFIQCFKVLNFQKNLKRAVKLTHMVTRSISFAKLNY